MENCCIWLVIYLNCTMMHVLTNLKMHIAASGVSSEFQIQVGDGSYCKLVLFHIAT